MCIVVDAPSFIPMFKSSDPEHDKFSHVKIWVENGPGRFVVGGSAYKKELFKLGSILKHITELERKRKVIRMPDHEVDMHEECVKKIEPSTDFDDPHLVALVRASKSKLICVRDARSHRFLKRSDLYAPTRKPKLYTSAMNKKLLSKKNIPTQYI